MSGLSRKKWSVHWNNSLFNPSSFRRRAFVLYMRKLFAFLSALILLAPACSPNANLQGAGESYLQGEWQQETTTIQKQLVSYSLYHFKFTCDSVFIKQQTFSSVNYGSDTCMSKGRWTEYMRGTYDQKNDTVHIKGVFCNADYSSKEPGGCFRSGLYEDFFKVTQKRDSSLQLIGTSSIVPVNLRLTQKLTCHIKPL